MKYKYLFLALLCFLKSFAQKKDFKVIGYFMPRVDVKTLDYKNLTHINYSFAIPSKTGDTLEPLKDPQSLVDLVKTAHYNHVKVFISIGGWGIGDGGGDDSRFHRMAETASGRATFIASVMQFVNKYGVDGVDLDWEYPDPEHRSADDFVLLCKDLYTQLHSQKLELSAAVVSAGKQSYGTKEEVFKYMDWLNIMVYDGDYGPAEIKHHSPYSMAVKCLDFWLNERHLPAAKCVLGLPFYAKKGQGNFGFPYNKLLESGASHFDDYWNGHYYNGTITIENKTKLAISSGCSGVMIWEISHDTHDEHSLLGVINKVKNAK